MSHTALFLGGTKGLGLEMAKIAIDKGMQATIAGRSAESCSLVREGRSLGVVMDLESDHAFQNLPHPLEFPTYDLIVWSAGVHQQGSVLDLGGMDFERLCRINFQTPATLLVFLLRKNREVQQACHLVVIGSSSSYATRDDQALYGALKAAKAQFARNLGRELPKEIPGSKVLLAQPGGMKTPFWEGREEMATEFMDPAAVAAMIWDDLTHQETPFREIHIVRQPDRSPKLEVGPKLPV